MQPISRPPYILIHPDDFVHPTSLTHRDEGRTVSVDGAQFTLLTGKSPCAAGMGVILATLPPAFGGLGKHLHRQTTELCHVLRGALAFTCGAEIGIARAGSMLLLPAGVAHLLWNPTSEPVTYLTIYSPAGAEQFVAQLAQDGAVAHGYDYFPVDG